MGGGGIYDAACIIRIQMNGWLPFNSPGSSRVPKQTMNHKKLTITRSFVFGLRMEHQEFLLYPYFYFINAIHSRISSQNIVTHWHKNKLLKTVFFANLFSHCAYWEASDIQYHQNLTGLDFCPL